MKGKSQVEEKQEGYLPNNIIYCVGPKDVQYMAWHASGGIAEHTCLHHRTFKSMMLSCMIWRHVTCGHGGQRIASSVSHYHVGHTPVPTQRLDDVPATWSPRFPRFPCRTGLFLSTTHAKRDILAS